MTIILVANDPSEWPLEAPGVHVVAAWRYLTDPFYNSLKNVRVFNLCRDYGYQSLGYYVSLLAEARGHKPQPDVITIQDMKSVSLARVISEDLEELIQRALRKVRTQEFTLSIYFGRTLAQRDARLGMRLFDLFRNPLMRAQFARVKEKWRLQSLGPIPSSEIPATHRDAVLAAARAYFMRRQWSGSPDKPARYSLAVLVDPDEKEPPSNAIALQKLERAADRADVEVDFITKEDFSRLGVFDALFIRATTYVNHYTYRFARRAMAEGLAVIDDPVSIARCTNKVYLAERLSLAKVPTPPTMIVHRGNLEAVIPTLGLPAVLKQPDSAFSMGVAKVDTEEEYRLKVREYLERSDLVVAQSFVPTEFDWRVGVLDGKPLFVCKYFMARRHWQIMKWEADGSSRSGGFEARLLHQDFDRMAERLGTCLQSRITSVRFRLRSPDWAFIP